MQHAYVCAICITVALHLVVQELHDRAEEAADLEVEFAPDTRLVRTLLTHGAGPNELDGQAQTPLHIAIMGGLHEVARLGSARLDLARLDSTRLDSTSLGSARLNSTRLDSTCFGSARLNSTCLGSTRLYSARLDSTRLDST